MKPPPLHSCDFCQAWKSRPQPRAAFVFLNDFRNRRAPLQRVAKVLLRREVRPRQQQQA